MAKIFLPGCLLLVLYLSGVELHSLLGGDYKVNCVKCHSGDSNKINVHLVPHSHDDVGWLKTYDQYYYGLNTSIQAASVQYIISSVVEALLENSDRRFIQVETAFFWKWWNDQSDHMKNNFKQLVENGQLEMVNGGWAMNDEACTNYQSTIDQFTLGIRLIEEAVGTCGRPRVGWQIDPFGHSREQASIFARLGFDGLFFARLDHDDKTNRQKHKALDFAWQGSSNLDNTVIFGSIFPTPLYYPPSGFCWDILCTDDVIDDDPKSADYNIDESKKKFKDLVFEYAKFYPTKNVLIPMGGDFLFSAADAYYTNIDRFIKAFKDDDNITVFYSTPSCYIKNVHDAKPNLTLKTDDFFPYSNDANSFWAGYFSSRPNSKRFERVGHGILQATNQLYTAALLKTGNSTYSDSLQNLREVSGTLQHHDAITGTEKQHVVDDYVKQLHDAIIDAEHPAGEAIKKLLKVDDSKINLEFTSCLLSNVSICTASQDADKMVVVVYNPLAWTVTHYVRLPVNLETVNEYTYKVEGPHETASSVVTQFNYFGFVHIDNEKPSFFELVFEAVIPPLSFNTYYVTRQTAASQVFEPTFIVEEDQVEVQNSLGADATFGDKNTSFTIDGSTNVLKSVTMNGITVAISQDFYYYNASAGTDKSKIAAGAYLFRPTGDSMSIPSGVSIVRTVTTPWYQEVQLKWTRIAIADIVESIRVYTQEKYIEFDWMVGNILLGAANSTGVEIVSKFTVNNFDNKNVFYTDSNGRELIKRTKDSRPDYKYDANVEPIASNYYPVTSGLVIRDEDKKIEVAVLNDRSQGATSLNKGELEFLIHRRLFKDDNKGVAESLNETEFGSTGVYVRGSHYLIIGPANNSQVNDDGLSTRAQERILAHKKLLQPWVGVASTNLSATDLKDVVNQTYSIFSEEFPKSVNVLTFELWKKDMYIVRLEHILEQDEDPNLSENVLVDLSKLVKGKSIRMVMEHTLGAAEMVNGVNSRRYTWALQEKPMEVVKPPKDKSSHEIYLTPMQIRTFIIEFKDTKSLAVSPQSISLFFILVVSFILNRFMN